MFSLLTVQHYGRFYDNSDNENNRDTENMISSLFELFGAVVISDFVPYLRFVTRLQGHTPKFAEVRDV